MSESGHSSSLSTSRTQLSDTLPSENQPYADALAQQLLSLHEENTRIGKQNQELSAKLHDVTTYNQTLGLDLYRLDNDINDLEDRLESNREKTKHIIDQTKILKKKTEMCKTALNKDEQMSELAKKFQAMQHFKEKADKSVQELQKIFDDPNLTILNSSLDLISEKIHFLYWNNNELNEQIAQLDKMVKGDEAVRFTELKAQWEQIQIENFVSPKSGKKDSKDEGQKETDDKKGENEKGTNSKDIQEPNKTPKSGAKLRINRFKKKSNVVEPEMKSDAPQKVKGSTFSSVFGENDDENDDREMKSEAAALKVTLPDSDISSNDKNTKRSHRSALNASIARRSKNSSSISSKNNNFPDNNNIINNGKEEEALQSDSSKMTYQSMVHPPFSDGTNSRSQKSTSSSKSSSKSSRFPNDNSSQLADESESSKTDSYSHVQNSNNAENNVENNENSENNDKNKIRLKFSQSKVSVRNENSNAANSRGESSRSVRTASRHKRSLPPKKIDESSDSGEYDYYESEPPPNPKKGTIRISKNNPEYEYEYYDSEDDEEADDEYEFVEENDEIPEKVIVGKAKKVDDTFEPVVVKTFTKEEYENLKFNKPKLYQCNEKEGEKIISVKKKNDLKNKKKGENSEDESENEIIIIKKSAKTIDEEQNKEKEKKLISVIIKPKKTEEEIKKINEEIEKEELLKKYEERSFERAILDEEKIAQKKIDDESELKDKEENYVKRTIQQIQNKKSQKRMKLEKIKEDEEKFAFEKIKFEANYNLKITELKKQKEEDKLNEAIEQEKKALIFKMKAKKNKEQIEQRKKEKELKEKQKSEQVLNEKEEKEKIIEEKRIKAQKLKDEEILKHKLLENEEKEKKKRDKQFRELKLKETQEREKERAEKERKEKEEMEKKKAEKERNEKERIKQQKIEQKMKEEEEKKAKEIEIQELEKKRQEDLQKKKKIIEERLEKERIEREEKEKEEKEKARIKQEAREKRRKEREQREKERIEREKREQELKELYDGIVDIPVKRMSKKSKEEEEKEKEKELLLKNSNSNDRKGSYNENENDSKNWSDDSSMSSTSESMAELDVATPVSYEETKLAELHDKNGKHTHSGVKKVRRRRELNKNSTKYGNNNEKSNDYEYDYEYEYDNYINDAANSSRSEQNRNNNGPFTSNFLPTDEKEAELLAIKEQQRLQLELSQLHNSNIGESPSKHNSDEDDEIVEISRTAPRTIGFSQQNSPCVSPRLASADRNDSPNKNVNFDVSSDFDEYTTVTDLISLNNNNNSKENNLESDASEAFQSDNEANDDPTKVKTTKVKNNDDGMIMLGFDPDLRPPKSSINTSTSMQIETERPVRTKKEQKSEFVPEYYNIKPIPKFQPIVVGTVKKSQKNSPQPLIVKKAQPSPESLKPVVVESFNIPRPSPITINPDDFTILKTKEQIEAENAEKEAKEERLRIHAEKEKSYRHTIDPNGNEYEYNYDYDYEYENSENENEKEEEENNTEKSDKEKVKNQKKALHATYRNSDDFLKELANEVAKADSVVKEKTEILKQREESISHNKTTANNESKDANENNEGKSEPNNNKEISISGKTKKRVKTTKRVRRIKNEENNIDNNGNNKNGKVNNGNYKKLNDGVNPNDNVEDEMDFGLDKKLGTSAIKQSVTKRPISSVRRQRVSPISPKIGNSENGKSNVVGRFSTRRRNRDSNESLDINTHALNEIEEEEEENDDNNDLYSLSKLKQNSNLLVDADLDSRPVSPKRPRIGAAPSSSSIASASKDNNEDDIMEMEEEEEEFYEYEEVVEYEYVSENDDKNEDNKSKSKHCKFVFNDSLSEDEEESINFNRNGKINNNGINNNSNDKKKAKNNDDFTENEKTFDSRSNIRLNNLVSKVRADAANLTNEDLEALLAKLKIEIEAENKTNAELMTKLKSLEKVRDHQIDHTFSRSKISSFGIEPIDFSKNFDIKNCQTEITNGFLAEIEETLTKQSKEKQELLELQKRIEIAQQQVVTLDGSIKTAEQQTNDKKKAIEDLKIEILKVKEELAKSDYDTTQDEQQSKQCEAEIEKLENQVQQSQQKLERVSQQISELQLRLQEMVNYRAVLEAELNDIYNREKPEVRQLIDDVKNAKTNSEDLQGKIQQMTKRIESRRDEIMRIKNSNEKKKADELKLTKLKLERRIKKWEKLTESKETAQSIESFSARFAVKREALIHEIDNKTRQLWEKSEQIEALHEYSELIEAMLVEHKNWTS